MGPWNAARDFLLQIKLKKSTLNSIINIDIVLYGSLAKTGHYQAWYRQSHNDGFMWI